MTFYGNSVHRIDELLNLVEYIPISGDIPSNGRFMDKATIDSKFYIENIKQSASFRDIVRLINIELLKTPLHWKGAIIFEQMVIIQMRDYTLRTLYISLV